MEPSRGWMDSALGLYLERDGHYHGDSPMEKNCQRCLTKICVSYTRDPETKPASLHLKAWMVDSVNRKPFWGVFGLFSGGFCCNLGSYRFFPVVSFLGCLSLSDLKSGVKT